MNDSKQKEVEKYLAKPEIHQQWISKYRTAENDKFFKHLFDYIAHVLNAPKNSIILDAGCGTCAHSIRLAERGFMVRAVDFSENVLKEAEANIKDKGFETKINIQQENILSLSFKDETFSYILSWGVLMHIPVLETAISELTRILKPGGILVIGEGNMHSLQSIILRNLKRFLGKEKTIVKKEPAGIEHWKSTSTGTLLTRETNMQWLIERLKSKQLTVIKRVAGQFTEVYIKVSSPLLKYLIHSFNNFWFQYIKIPYPAFGNLLILQKEK